MREISSVLGGMGLLIFTYLVVANYSGTTQVAAQLGNTGVSLITALQGRTTS